MITPIPFVDYHRKGRLSQKEDKFSSENIFDYIKNRKIEVDENRKTIERLYNEGFISGRFENFLGYFNDLSYHSDMVSLLSRIGYLSKDYFDFARESLFNAGSSLEKLLFISPPQVSQRQLMESGLSVQVEEANRIVSEHLFEFFEEMSDFPEELKDLARQEYQRAFGTYQDYLQKNQETRK